jgi:hypothetical protein
MHACIWSSSALFVIEEKKSGRLTLHYIHSYLPYVSEETNLSDYSTCCNMNGLSAHSRQVVSRKNIHKESLDKLQCALRKCISRTWKQILAPQPISWWMTYIFSHFKYSTLLHTYVLYFIHSTLVYLLNINQRSVTLITGNKKRMHQIVLNWAD